MSGRIDGRHFRLGAAEFNGAVILGPADDDAGLGISRRSVKLRNTETVIQRRPSTQALNSCNVISAIKAAVVADEDCAVGCVVEAGMSNDYVLVRVRGLRNFTGRTADYFHGGDRTTSGASSQLDPAEDNEIWILRIYPDDIVVSALADEEINALTLRGVHQRKSVAAINAAVHFSAVLRH